VGLGLPLQGPKFEPERGRLLWGRGGVVHLGFVQSRTTNSLMATQMTWDSEKPDIAAELHEINTEGGKCGPAEKQQGLYPQRVGGGETAKRVSAREKREEK